MKLKRRDLIKGAVGAPLALTLRPGGALARSSSLLCLTKDAVRASTPPQPVPILPAGTQEDWMRGLVDLLQVSLDNGATWSTERYYVGTDQASLWQITASISGETATRHPTYTINNVMTRRTGEQRAVLSYVDANGTTITGYAMEPNGGNPVTGSCWSSVKAAV